MTLKDMARAVERDNEAAFERYAKRPGFKAWAYEGGPDDNRRVAVIKDPGFSGLRWADLYVDRGDVKTFRSSSGAFYDDSDDHPEGALEWAKSSARAYVEGQKKYQSRMALPPGIDSGRPSMPPGTKRG